MHGIPPAIVNTVVMVACFLCGKEYSFPIVDRFHGSGRFIRRYRLVSPDKPYNIECISFTVDSGDQSDIHQHMYTYDSDAVSDVVEKVFNVQKETLKSIHLVAWAIHIGHWSPQIFFRPCNSLWTI